MFTPDLRIVKAKYDKYKQINRFIELVDDAFRASEQQEITILDFGCGKSYLTFILYYYFTVKRGVKATILGYDLKEDVVEHCNAIAQKYGYDGLRFVVSDVTRDTLADTHVDMVVTLHACDTATDYALWYAVEKGVKHIFSVPCCQHEINATIHKGGDFDVLLRHGLLQERFSALLTDSIRAAVLEDMGYTVDVIEFIDFAHSPKNLMLRCVKDRRAGERNLSAAWELAEKYGFTLDTPIAEMPDGVKDILLYGSKGEKRDLSYERERKNSSFAGKFSRPFEGICKNLERRYFETQSPAMRAEIEECMSEVTCPECHGQRLRKEALAVTVGGINIARMGDMSVIEAIEFVESLELSEKEHTSLKKSADTLKNIIAGLDLNM